MHKNCSDRNAQLTDRFCYKRTKENNFWVIFHRNIYAHVSSPTVARVWPVTFLRSSKKCFYVVQKNKIKEQNFIEISYFLCVSNFLCVFPKKRHVSDNCAA